MADGQKYEHGIIGRPAPKWGVTEWYNLPAGKKTLDITDFEGRVVYLFGFQSWCPGCHSHGFPTLKQVEKRFHDDDDVVFIAVQTVFEGFGTNTAEAALEDVEEFGLDIPMGHDAGPDNRHSTLMTRYRSGGTPWTVIIDPEGIVQFNGFRIQAKEATALIDRLLEQAASISPGAGSTGGAR